MYIRMRCYEKVIEDRELNIDERYCERLTEDINRCIVGDPIATLTPDEVAAIYTGSYEDEETEEKFTCELTFTYKWSDNESKTFTSSLEDWVLNAIGEDLWDCVPEWVDGETYDKDTVLIGN